MHRVPLAETATGMRLAEPLYADTGGVLLARGASLNERYLRQLDSRGFSSVFVMDGIADDVIPEQLVSTHLRETAASTLKGLFELVFEATRPIRDEAAKEGAHVLVREPLEVSPRLENQLHQLSSVVENILNEVMDKETIGGLVALKSHDNYTFQHSVDVAVFGAITGRRLNIGRQMLRELTLGCLLHDIGKLYVDERILNKPGKLTDAEFEQIMEHPLLGFQLLAQLPLESLRARHIVLQHHERQDGGGYPNKLFGANKLSRSKQERFDPRRISLLAEICAVVDVYSAVVSDRPYRSAMPAGEVVDLLLREGGGHLNAEIVRLFLGLVQAYPVGSSVRLEGGCFDGYLGIVTRRNRSAPDRPVVRLLFDPKGKAVSGDAELNLLKEPNSVTGQSIGELGAPIEAYLPVRP